MFPQAGRLSLDLLASVGNIAGQACIEILSHQIAINSASLAYPLIPYHVVSKP